MPHTCHPLHQYPFLGHSHRLLPQITVALLQTCVTYQHPTTTALPQIDVGDITTAHSKARSFICSSTKSQAMFSV
ncbi:hypothetical protein Hanom_Chr00s038791g01773411 [Helianthus anomalus]